MQRLILNAVLVAVLFAVAGAELQCNSTLSDGDMVQLSATLSSNWDCFLAGPDEGRATIIAAPGQQILSTSSGVHTSLLFDINNHVY
jgi:hypothetical protein